MRSAILCLLAAVSLPLPAFGGALIDQNNNGLDDVWEMIFHANGMDPNADPDGDGFTNAQEAAAGTDPRDPNSHPPRLSIAAVGAGISLTWRSVAGKVYRLQSSPNCGANAVWTNLGTPFYGTGADLSAAFGTGTARAQFYRILTSDADSANSGVSDWDKLQLGFNPFLTDTFNTGFGDRQTILDALASADTVSVATDASLATPSIGGAGVLRFTRRGNLDAVTARYRVGGTAVPGTDYLPLTGTVSFPVGVNTATANVALAPGAAFAGTRTVVATLLAGPGYQLDPDPAAGAATVTLTAQLPGPGQVIAESWDNLTDYNLNAVPFATPPTRRAILTRLELPTNTGLSQYGTRISGYLTAPATGVYTFWVAADDQAEFRLSSDDQMANLALRAYQYSYVVPYDWNHYPEQRSAAILLTAGQRYAFECRFYQGGGGDNFAVGWLKPGQSGSVPSEVVPGSALTAYTAPYNPPGVTTLYFGALQPLAGAPPGAAGFASVRLAADDTLGIVSLAASGLSGPPTSLALHGPANPGQTGPVVAEFAAAQPQADGTYLWQIADPGAVAALKAGRVYAGAATAAHPGGELAGQLLRSAGTGAFTPPPAPPALPATPPSPGDAARLLTQATFGATAEGIAAIQRDGYAAWVDAQLNAPPTLTLPYLNAFAAGGNPLSDDIWQESWWKNALTAPDQLRQRVAFALSEIMVVSDVSDTLASRPAGLASYYDVLERDAFGSFRTLLEDVTLHPVMGAYLNMLHNAKADPAAGTEPNENYGREVMQLFTIGVQKLNPDGSLLLDSQARPIPAYGQDEVKGLSRVFTGYNFGRPGLPDWNYFPENYFVPMRLVPDYHETGPKRLLNNVVLPAEQSGEQDLKDALDLLANHPNTGPFICRQLIQRLVTSNPSPGYVYRVAQVFADNGRGARGDLRAVARAILLDYEARSPDAAKNPNYGKQREPAIRLANVYRAFNARSGSGRYEINEGDTAYFLGQAALHAPSVFNFFAPNYTLPGEIASAGLVCPEFALTTATSVVLSSNALRDRVARTASPYDQGDPALDLRAQQALAGSPAALVDSLNALLLNGQMSDGLRAQAISAVTGVDPLDPLGRARTAVQILCTSPEFCIQK